MELLILLPHQLFNHHKLYDLKPNVLLLEHPHFFEKRIFHKQKLIFHRASMKAFADRLKKEKLDVTYIEFKDVKKTLMGLKNKHILAIDPIEHPLWEEYEELAKKNASFSLYPSPMFLTSKEVKETFMKKSKGHYSMQSFYILQRKALDLLMDGEQPLGGKWSFDTENRKAFPKKGFITPIKFPKPCSYVKEATLYVEKHFPKNFGDLDLLFPIDPQSCHAWLEYFLKERLSFFGDYEDAIVPEEHFLYHSGLSPLLNVGLLTPQDVVDATISYAKKHQVGLNNLEGFLRQIVGWREFMKLMYDIRGKELIKENYFKSKKKLPSSFWQATTGIEPIDQTIRKIQKSAYAHHIERLMILGNFMLLSEYDPKEVYEWFMSLFIDAYEWVMVTNVMSMSQYADGGIMTTKPYISSSNYILKMSQYSKGPWCEIWDALFWTFLDKHRTALGKNPRMGMMMTLLKKQSKEKIKGYYDILKR